MHHFPHFQTFELKPGQTPIVFLGTHDNNCLPTVTAAASDGFYRMTRRVIEAGHRDIVVCCNPRNSRAQTADLLEGHQRAMRESNLAVNAEAIECSLATDHDQLSNLQGYIRRFSDATAIISVSGQTAHRLMEVAGLMGINVPQQLSIASLGHGPNIPGRKLTGLIYDWETIAKASLDILIEQSKTRKCLLARMEYRPRLFPGDTLSQPHRRAGH